MVPSPQNVNRENGLRNEKIMGFVNRFHVIMSMPGFVGAWKWKPPALRDPRNHRALEVFSCQFRLKTNNDRGLQNNATRYKAFQQNKNSRVNQISKSIRDGIDPTNHLQPGR